MRRKKMKYWLTTIAICIVAIFLFHMTFTLSIHAMGCGSVAGIDIMHSIYEAGYTVSDYEINKDDSVAISMTIDNEIDFEASVDKNQWIQTIKIPTDMMDDYSALVYKLVIGSADSTDQELIEAGQRFLTIYNAKESSSYKDRNNYHIDTEMNGETYIIRSYVNT